MARDTLVESSTLTAIADAIREKTETSDAMYPSEMAGKIRAIEGASTGKYVWKKSEVCLESSGTQYIYTGVKPNSTMSLEIKFSTTTSYYNTIGSVDLGWQTTGFGIGANNFQYGSNLNASQNFYNGNVHVVKISPKGAEVDGATVATFTESSWSIDYTLVLFALNRNGEAQEFLNGKIWYAKIWEGSNLIRHFVPAVNNGVVCMYDNASGTYYTNQGTGDFALVTSDDFVYIADDDENKYPDGDMLDGYYYERVETGGIPIPVPIVAGDIVVKRADLAEATSTRDKAWQASGIYVIISKAGTYRFKYELSKSYNSTQLNSQLRKNGVEISGTIWGSESQIQDGYTSHDITCNSGDRIEIYYRGTTAHPDDDTVYAYSTVRDLTAGVYLDFSYFN